MIAQTSANVTNASADMMASVNSTWGLGGVAVMLILVVVAVIGSQTVYRWIIESAGYFAQSIEYAIKGVATALFIGAIVTPLYLLTQLDGGIRWLLLQGVAVAILGYVTLVALGIVGEFVWSLVKRRHREVTGHDPFADSEEGEQ